MKLGTRAAGAFAASASALAMMGAPAIAQSSPFSFLSSHTPPAPPRTAMTASGDKPSRTTQTASAPATPCGIALSSLSTTASACPADASPPAR